MVRLMSVIRAPCLLRGVVSVLLMAIPLFSSAAQPPLRFAVTESWSMPMIRFENHQPTAGIMFDIMQSLARQVGRDPVYHVMPRLRVQSALEHNEVDLHCYSAQAWYPNLSGDYMWSLPILYQRDWLVASAETAAGAYPNQFDSETVGTVLGYNYPALQALFDNHQLVREDARTLEQALAKLVAGRYNYAITTELILDWTNSRLAPDKRLKPIALVGDQPAACMVRNNPDLPIAKILRTLLRMRMTGEIQKIIEHYTTPRTP
ncbi:ABC transporter substrate-binding protein [Pseudomonas sp. CDFA 602]|nr:ABC transporter substrate-binding protein [Pseudomonas californiensis]MCD5998787.1 ABC transporter substrate-binding protein [Pseudomonas californiensis]